MRSREENSLRRIWRTGTCSKRFSTHAFDAALHVASFILVGESVKKPARFCANNVVHSLNVPDTMVAHSEIDETVTAMNPLLSDNWSQRMNQGINRILNKYGDGVLFRSIGGTPPIQVNPHADTGIHTAVPHRYLYAYLTAIKSFLRYYADIAVYVHDDGSLRNEDKELIRAHIPGAKVIDRSWADQAFADKVGDEFLMKVRKSYTSYLKLFDPTLVSTNKRIIIVDTDVLFLNRPTAIIEWAEKGGAAWFHRSGPWMKKSASPDMSDASAQSGTQAQPTHIQHMVVQRIPEMNEALHKNYAFVHGFNSGFIGYDQDTVRYDELKDLLTYLYGMLGDRIFRWGSEQTMHGLTLCSKGAVALPTDEYMVYTDLVSEKAAQANFVHFIGEFRFNRLLYPRLAAKVIRGLKV